MKKKKKFTSVLAAAFKTKGALDYGYNDARERAAKIKSIFALKLPKVKRQRAFAKITRGEAVNLDNGEVMDTTVEGNEKFPMQTSNKAKYKKFLANLDELPAIKL